MQEWSQKAKRDAWPSNFCEAGISEVLTSVGRQGECVRRKQDWCHLKIWKRWAKLLSV